MKSILIIVSFYCSILFAHGKAVHSNLAVSNLSEELKKNAHAIIRYDSTTITIENLNIVHYRSKYAVTILNEQGKKYAYFIENYNLLNKINNIEGKLLDDKGAEIRSLKNKDVFDQSSYGTSFIYHSDSRTKSYTFNHEIYPYTVIFEMDKTIKTTFLLPGWHTQPGINCAVESSSLLFKYPEKYNFRFKEYLLPNNTMKSENINNSMVEKAWALGNIFAYKSQPFSVNENFQSPTVIIAPDEFELLSIKGSMKTWNNFGKFNFELNENRDLLPEDKKAIVKSLTKGVDTEYEKIQKLYAYMQENNRYVANEYGLAGWQTFDAINVAQNGYGDCKGLTNYLKALLKEAGIKSYVALISAGSEYYKLDKDFPANYFNHVILCVPQENDSIWIECTSQTLPAGYLGSFTQDRFALLTTETGGYICRTPHYDKAQNTISRNTYLALDNNASEQKISFENVYSGLLQDDICTFVKNNSKDKVMEWTNKKYAFPSYNTTDFDYQYLLEKRLPILKEKLNIVASGIINKTQKRTFINMTWMTNPMIKIVQTDIRTKPLVLNKSYTIIDTIKMDLPDGMNLELMPSNTLITFPFAKYESSFEKKGNQIYLVSKYEQNEGVYDISEYNNYQKLYNIINSNKESMNIVLLNKQ